MVGLNMGATGQSLPSLFFFRSSDGYESNRILAEFDVELIARIEVQHGGVGLANQQISVALNFCGVAELASAFANRSTTSSKVDALGFEESLVERSEIQAIAPILLFGYVAASPNKVGLGYVAKIFYLREKVAAGKHWIVPFG